MNADRLTSAHRGAPENPANRFEPIHLEPDAEWNPEEDPLPRTKLFVDHTVNILSENQSAISTRFARALTDKWDGVNVCPGLGGVPLLSDALAWIECRSYAKYDGGDHLIIVGEVRSLGTGAVPGTRPLVFFGGKYRQLDRDATISTPPDADQWLHGW